MAWKFLDEWKPREGQWAILWPGYYGPFAACWLRGRWTMCEDIDFKHAMVAMPFHEPSKMVDRFPPGERDLLPGATP